MRRDLKPWRFWTCAGLVSVLIIVVVIDILARTKPNYDPQMWGTVSGWVTGMATVLVAGLAARYAYLSAKASKRSARLQAWSMPVEFEVRIDAPIVGGVDQGAVNDVKLTLVAGSVPVTITEAGLALRDGGLLLAPSPATEQDGDLVNQWFQDLRKVIQVPCRLSPGQTHIYEWATTSLSDGRTPMSAKWKEWAGRATITYVIDQPDGETSEPLTRDFDFTFG